MTIFDCVPKCLSPSSGTRTPFPRDIHIKGNSTIPARDRFSSKTYAAIQTLRLKEAVQRDVRFRAVAARDECQIAF